jgi:hypothetical protein
MYIIHIQTDGSSHTLLMENNLLNEIFQVKQTHFVINIEIR